MLQLFGSGLISLWLDMTGVHVKPLDTLELLALLAALVSPSADPNPTGDHSAAVPAATGSLGMVTRIRECGFSRDQC